MKNKIKLILALTMLMLNPIITLAGGALYVPDFFTYQGELLKNNQPANGSYEFKVEIYNFGVLLSSEEFIGADAVTVTNGLFTLEVDIPPAFGDAIFTVIDISVRENSTQNYVLLSPSQVISSALYSQNATNAENAENANYVNANGVNSFAIQDASITTAKIANGAVTSAKLAGDSVTSAKIANGTIVTADIASQAVTRTQIAANTIQSSEVDSTQIQERVTGTCAAGSSIRVIAQDGTVTCETDDVGTPFAGWGLTGNAGTTSGTNFLGTTDQQDLILKVNNANAIKISTFDPNNNESPNFLFGSNTFSGGISNSILGGTGNFIFGRNSSIAGGNNNGITISGAAPGLSFIGGGISNRIDSRWSVIPGGFENYIGADTGFAIGDSAHIRNPLEAGNSSGDVKTFIWSQTGVTSTGPNQVLFEATGGFGIGTNAPASPLHIKGQGTTFGSAVDEVVATIEPKISTDNVSLALNKTDASTQSALLFSTNKTPNFDIRSSFGGASITFNGYDAGTQTAMMTIFDKSINRIDMNAHVEPQAGSVFNMGSSSFRWLTVYSQNPLDTPSDRRLKKDIKEMDYGLSEILAMRPVTYHWKKGDTKRTNLGLIAQEVETIVPEIVQKAEDEKQTRSMRYAELIPVLIKATQEQQTLIEQQNNKIAKLELMLEKLMQSNHK